MEDYNEYVRIFNTGNDALLIDTFFTFPFTFSTPFMNQTYKDKDEFLKGLIYYHRVRECLDPQLILYGDHKVFVNLEVIFHSAVEWLDFPYGPIRPGDMLLNRAFVVYTLNEQKRIVLAEEMFWPPDYLNKPVLRLGGSDTQRAALDAFIGGFNAGRYEAITAFFTEQAKIELFGTKLSGKKEFVDHYQQLAAAAEVQLEIKSAICDNNGLYLDLAQNYKAKQDCSDIVKTTLKAGESLSQKIQMVCKLENGLIASLTGTVQ